MLKSSRAGFTLIELLIVVVIIGSRFTPTCVGTTVCPSG